MGILRFLPSPAKEQPSERSRDGVSPPHPMLSPCGVFSTYLSRREWSAGQLWSPEPLWKETTQFQLPAQFGRGHLRTKQLWGPRDGGTEERKPMAHGSGTWTHWFRLRGPRARVAPGLCVGNESSKWPLLESKPRCPVAEAGPWRRAAEEGVQSSSKASNPSLPPGSTSWTVSLSNSIYQLHVWVLR